MEKITEIEAVEESKRAVNCLMKYLKSRVK